MRKRVLILLAVLCQGSQAFSQPVADMIHIASGGFFSIRYPVSWEYVKKARPGIFFQVFAPVEDPKDNFRENVNVVIEDLQGRDISFTQYIDATRRNFKATVQGFSMQTEKEMMLGSYKAYEFNYTGTFEVYRLRMKQVLVLFEGRVFTLTYTGSMSSYNKFEAEADRIMSSIKLLHVAPIVKESPKAKPVIKKPATKPAVKAPVKK